MAENVKRRVAAARLAVAFVAATTIAGATAWASAGPPPPQADSSAVDVFQKHKIDSGDIKNGSLLYQDFKSGEVLSSNVFVKYKKAIADYKLDVKGDVGTIKGELGDIKLQIGDIKGESKDFLKLADTDSRYLKLSDAVVRGDGSVFNAIKEVSLSGQQGLVPLIGLPGMIDVNIVSGEQEIKITNTGGSDLLFSQCTGGQGGTLRPTESVSCNINAQSQVMQLIGAGGGSTVVTLNFTALPAVQAGSMKYIIAILVGM
jgi:hypothetical protein